MKGPTIRNIPSQRERVCNGCEFLHTTPMMRGHKSVTDNYGCTHPDFAGEIVLAGMGKGRSIHFNHEGSCTTPDWCPFLKPKQNEATEKP